MGVCGQCTHGGGEDSGGTGTTRQRTRLEFQMATERRGRDVGFRLAFLGFFRFFATTHARKEDSTEHVFLPHGVENVVRSHALVQTVV